ncbi:hypothetical protein AcV5_006223 [Taiwanofungus camphoratus]|nr:hypothetical protein AcV5_006223 [Antrodia cinnamomea]
MHVMPRLLLPYTICTYHITFYQSYRGRVQGPAVCSSSQSRARCHAHPVCSTNVVLETHTDSCTSLHCLTI